MKIESFNQFKKLVQLCQDSGVASIEVDGIKMSLRPQPAPSNNPLALQPEAYIPVPTYRPIQAQETQDEPITQFNDNGLLTSMRDELDTPDMLTDEQALFYSSKAEPN